MITGVKISRSFPHDSVHARTLLRQCHRTRRSGTYVMEKGYDAEELHRLIRETLGDDSVILLRNRKRKRVNGRYRKLLSMEFDEAVYNRRNLAETIFSVMKWQYGDSVRARKYRSQVKEIKARVVIYNIGR